MSKVDNLYLTIAPAILTMILLDVLLTLFLWQYWGVDIYPTFLNVKMHILAILTTAALEVFTANQWAKWYVLRKESHTVRLVRQKLDKVPEFNTYKLWGLVSLPVIIFGLNIIFLISGYEFYFDAPHWYAYLTVLWASPESATGYQFTFGQYLVPGLFVISTIGLWRNIQTLRNWQTNTTLTYMNKAPEQSPAPESTHLHVVK